MAPSREFVCRVREFGTPFRLVFPPNQKFPSRETHRRGLKLRLRCPSTAPIGFCDWVLVPAIVDVARPEVGIGGEEPHSKVSIEYPVAPALGIAKFRFETPAVRAPVNQLRRIVLTGWSRHLETGSPTGSSASISRIRPAAWPGRPSGLPRSDRPNPEDRSGKGVSPRPGSFPENYLLHKAKRRRCWRSGQRS